MEKQPLTWQQAEELRDKFRHLAGQPLNEDPDGVKIDCVTIVPYDDINKYIFMLDYRECKDVDKALGFYNGQLYDVALISIITTDRIQVYSKDLHTYLAERNMNMESSNQ